MASPKLRLTIRVKPEEMKACQAMANKAGLRTPQQWALTVLLRALVIR